MRRKVLLFLHARVFLLLLIVCGVLAGIALSAVVHTAISWLVLCVPVVCLVVGRRRRFVMCAVVFVISSFCGYQRGSYFVTAQNRYTRIYDTKITATVIANNDAVYDARRQLVFAGHDLTIAGQPTYAGTVQVAGFGATAIFAGDIVAIQGKLRPPYGTGQGSIGFASLQVLEHRATQMGSVRRKLLSSIQTALPEPLAAFGSGLLIGQRATLPKPVKETLLTVGLTHIIAVSGYNVTILVNAARRSWLRYSKRVNSAAAVALLSSFVLLTGASASIMRAAIVSVLTIATSYYGRSVQPLLLLLIAAAVTGWITPFYVWGDPSWYLSFLAFAGILLFAPLLIAQWHIKNMLALVLIETISAELMTIPYILATFGQISLIALPANVLVVSLIPFAMLATAVAAVAGLFVSSIAGWFAWPAQYCLTYMLDIAQLLSKVPHSFQKDIGFSLLQMGVSYGIVFMVYIMLRYQAYLRHDKITDITENLRRSPARERSQQMVNN